MGGPSCPKSYSCSHPHPHPQTPLPVLCFFQMARCRPRDGAGQLEPPEAQWEGQSGTGWQGVGQAHWEILSCVPASSLPMHSRDCWEAPREPQNLGFSCPLHIPHGLSPACFQLSRTASDFSVLPQQLWGPLGDPSQWGHCPFPSSRWLGRRAGGQGLDRGRGRPRPLPPQQRGRREQG